LLTSSIGKGSISAQKNTFALNPGWGSLKKAKEAGCQKQQQTA
jgi:hypothetical protein